jgi:hypothetical protein
MHPEARRGLGNARKIGGRDVAWIGARLVVGPTYATRRQLPAWMSGAHCSWKVETNPSRH